MRKTILAASLSTVLLAACGGGGGGGGGVGDRLDVLPPPQQQSSPSSTTGSAPSPAPPASTSTPPASSTQYEYGTWGVWASLDWDHFSVAGPISSDDGTAWAVQGAPTGSYDNLPTDADPLTDNVKYTGHVWGRVYDGFTRTPTGVHFDGGERVRGELTATYRPLSATRSMAALLSGMKKEYPTVDPTEGANWAPLPDMKFIGTINDDATFSLSAEGLEDRFGRESGETTGSFYGPNGEAVAGTFWYRRNGHRVEGAFGGERDD